MSDNKVLVLNSTGKVGKNVCEALKESGFDVYGTTRNAKNNLREKGITPVICNYVDKADLVKAFETTGIKKAFITTDFFLAAKGKKSLEIEQGKNIVDACKLAGCEFVVYSSVADPEYANDKVLHFKAKIDIENYLKASGLKFGLLRPVAFFGMLHKYKVHCLVILLLVLRLRRKLR